MTTLDQSTMQQRIVAACRRLDTDQLVYKSEWLGHLPYGQYHWVEVGGQEISREFPTGWQYSDLQALVDKGRLEVLAEFRPQSDSEDVEVRLRLVARP